MSAPFLPITTPGRAVCIVTRDKDLAQLLGRDDVFWDFAGKGKLIYDRIPEVFGVWPEQIADFLALAGDSVDNIPGVPGVGPKTASRLLEHFDSLEHLYADLQRVATLPLRGASKLGDKLALHREQAELSRELARICCDVPMEVDKASVARSAPQLDALNALYDAAGFGEGLRRQAQRIAERYPQ